MSVKDHPRTCGENILPIVLNFSLPGSPPHLRGKLNCHKLFYFINRITPAPAGKTMVSMILDGCKEDHPRTCGENYFPLDCELDSKGSPPHLRGKLLEHRQRARKNRITPAPAGKTPLALMLAIPLGDHPRTCGENYILAGRRKSRKGSPPHLRGKLVSF